MSGRGSDLLATDRFHCKTDRTRIDPVVVADASSDRDDVLIGTPGASVGQPLL
jgi:hypothetical protein